MKFQLALISSFSFLMVGCCHYGGCYNPTTGLVHSGRCGLFDNCGTGFCKKSCCRKKPCKCRSGCNQGCDSCHSQGEFGTTYPMDPMTYGDGMIYQGTGSADCPTCQGQQMMNYPELMVPHGEIQNQIVPAPAAETAPDSQTYTVPYPSNGMSIPPVSYSTTPSYLPPQMSSVPPIETAAF